MNFAEWSDVHGRPEAAPDNNAEPPETWIWLTVWASDNDKESDVRSEEHLSNEKHSKSVESNFFD